MSLKLFSLVAQINLLNASYLQGTVVGSFLLLLLFSNRCLLLNLIDVNKQQNNLNIFTVNALTYESDFGKLSTR